MLYFKLVAIVAVLGVVALGAYNRGKSDCEAAFNAARLDQIEAGEKLDDERRKIAIERDKLARELEEQAYAEPVVVQRCLSPSRVRRLNALD